MAVVRAGGVFAGRGAGDCMDEFRRASGKTGARSERAITEWFDALSQPKFNFLQPGSFASDQTTPAKSRHRQYSPAA